jgi:hypothetical protein
LEVESVVCDLELASQNSTLLRWFSNSITLPAAFNMLLGKVPTSLCQVFTASQICRCARPLQHDMVASNQITCLQAGNSVPGDRGEMCSHELKIGDLPVMHARQGKENVRKELVRVFPEEEKAIDEFIALMEKAKWQAGQFETFKIFPRWLQFLTSQLLCSAYIKHASRTTEEVLGEMTDDGRLKTVLSAFGGDLGESISEGSFVMQAAVLGHVLEGHHLKEAVPSSLFEDWFQRFDKLVEKFWSRHVLKKY